MNQLMPKQRCNSSTSGLCHFLDYNIVWLQATDITISRLISNSGGSTTKFLSFMKWAVEKETDETESSSFLDAKVLS